MKKSTTIYVDVTQLVHWGGKLTGIPRVMYELAVRFSQLPNVKYVSWVRQINAYCEVDYQVSVLNRDGIRYIKARESLTSAGTAPEASMSVSGRGKAIAKKVVNKAINATKYINSGLPTKIHDTLVRRQAQTYAQVSLNTGDSVFIPWGEWWDKGFLSMLVDAHQRGVKLSTFIHDVGPMVAPHLTGNSASLADYCSTVVPVCDAVFVNSKFTKKTLVKWLKEGNYTVPSIEVVTLGDDFKHKEAAKPSAREFTESGLLGDDYILTVGTVELKKNHIFYYYVYKLALERGIELPPLVIAGRMGWGTDMNVSIMRSDPELKGKFIFLSDTSDEELAWLYEHTLFSVFASMYEGWGLPLSESLFHGVPVVSARSTSLVEIGEGIIDRFTQASTDECLEAFQQMLKPDYREGKRLQVRSYKPATWDRCYEDIRDAMHGKEMV